MTPGHISTVPAVPYQGCWTVEPEPDGICHCTPQPESSAIGECPRCHRLDARKAFTR